MKYLQLLTDYLGIFLFIRKYLAFPDDPVPYYSNDMKGLASLDGVLERVKMEHYKSFFDKAAVLFTEIALGHYFENGNKRLALTSLTFFAQKNGYVSRKRSMAEHKVKLKKLFPEMEFGKRIKNINVLDNMLYFITVFAASGKSRGDDFNERLSEYLRFALKKTSSN